MFACLYLPPIKKGGAHTCPPPMQCFTNIRGGAAANQSHKPSQPLLLTHTSVLFANQTGLARPGQKNSSNPGSTRPHCVRLSESEMSAAESQSWPARKLYLEGCGQNELPKMEGWMICSFLNRKGATILMASPINPEGCNPQNKISVFPAALQWKEGEGETQKVDPSHKFGL